MREEERERATCLIRKNFQGHVFKTAYSDFYEGDPIYGDKTITFNVVILK